LNECAACSATLPAGSDVCELCGHKVGDIVPAAVPPSAGEAEPSPTASASAGMDVPKPSRGPSQRELIAAVGAVVVVGVVTVGFLAGRGPSSAQVAAANDAATSTPAAAREAVPSPPIDAVKWSGANVVHWTGRARNSAAFELHAENTVGVWMRNVRPLLVVRCMSKATEAFVITDSALKIEPQTDDHTVTIQFDSDPEIKERWEDAADHNAVFAPTAAPFIERLIRARTLRFGYTPHNAEPVVAVFHVNGLGPLLEPSAKHCSWTK
jgi:hypothetical protein